jgi:hypothetical protein
VKSVAHCTNLCHMKRIQYYTHHKLCMQLSNRYHYSLAKERVSFSYPTPRKDEQQPSLFTQKICIQIYYLHNMSSSNATMPAFRSLTADKQTLQVFRTCVLESNTAKCQVSDHTLPLHLFEWSRGQEGSESGGIKSIARLRSQNQSTIRVM